MVKIQCCKCLKYFNPENQSDFEAHDIACRLFIFYACIDVVARSGLRWNLPNICHYVWLGDYLAPRYDRETIYALWKPNGKRRRRYGEACNDVLDCARTLYNLDRLVPVTITVEEHLRKLYAFLGAARISKIARFLESDGDRACMARVVQCLFG